MYPGCERETTGESEAFEQMLVTAAEMSASLLIAGPAERGIKRLAAKGAMRSGFHRRPQAPFRHADMTQPGRPTERSAMRQTSTWSQSGSIAFGTACWLFGITGSEAILSASGTELEIIALFLARCMLHGPVTNLIIGPTETGKGVPLGAAGRLSAVCGEGRARRAD